MTTKFRKPWDQQPVKNQPQQKTVGMIEQNGILVPRGEITKQIIIQATDKGMIFFDAYNIDSQGVQSKMDTREMVLGLLKVVMDTTAVIFQQTGATPQDAKKGTDNGNDQTLPG